MRENMPDNAPVLKEDTRIESDKHEKRKDRRIRVSDIDMRSEMPLAGRVSVINISSGGLLVKADRRLNIGNTYLIKIAYKDTILFSRVIVKWSFLSESVEDANGNMVPIYMAGMQFKEMISGSEQGLMQALIADIEADALPHMEHAARYTENIEPEPRDKTGEHPLQEAKMHRSPSNKDVLHEHDADSLDMFIQNVEDEHKQISRHSANYYELLGVRDTAGAEEIKKAYIRKVKEFHPDRHLKIPPETREKLADILTHLNDAYSTLTNREQRLHYNRALLVKQPEKLSHQELAQQYFERGKIEFWNGNYTEARALFQHALYLHNTPAKYHYYLAKTLLKLGDYREAEKAIKRALKGDPSNSDYLTEAGYIYHALGLSNRAEENFGMALGIDPSHSQAQKGMQSVKDKKERFSDDLLFYPVRTFKKIITG